MDDSNNPITTSPINTPPVQPPASGPLPPLPEGSFSANKQSFFTNKKLILIVVAVVLVLSIAIVSVMLITKKGQVQKAALRNQQAIEQLSNLASQLETELSSIELGSPDTDLMEVDKDLESL